MEQKVVLRAIILYIMSITCAIIFTVLAGWFISYITSVFMNVALSTTPFLLGVCTVAIIIFTLALVFFTCATYGIVLWFAVSEVKARNRHHMMIYEHRQLKLEQHRRDLALHNRQRIATILHSHAANKRIAKQQNFGC